MPQAKAAELRRRAKEAKIPNWQSMERDELAKALKDHEANGHSPRMAKAIKAMGHAPRRRSAKKVAENKAITEGVKARRAAKAAKRKATARKAVVAKRRSRPSSPDNVNPFRPGSQLNAITEELLKGGKRQSIINRLRRQHEIHGYAEKSGEVDVDFEWDKRLLMAREKLIKLGWTYEAEGRGREGTLRVFPPSGAQRPAKARKAPVKRRSTRKATARR